MPNHHNHQTQINEKQPSFFTLIANALKQDDAEYFKNLSEYIKKSKPEDLIRCNEDGYSALEYALLVHGNKTHGSTVFIFLNNTLRAYLSHEEYVKLFDKPIPLHRGILQTLMRYQHPKITYQLLEIMSQPGLEKALEQNLTCKDKYGEMVLQTAIIGSSIDNLQPLLMILKNPKYLKLLEANLVNVNCKGDTALMNSIMSHHPERALLLLDLLEESQLPNALEVNLNHINNGGFTILQSALNTGKHIIVKRILRILEDVRFQRSLRLNLSHVTEDKFTALHQAATSGVVANWKILLTIMENPENLDILTSFTTACNQEGVMILSCALYSKNPEMIFAVLELLKKPSFKEALISNLHNIAVYGYWPLQNSICTNNLEVVQTIFSLTQEYSSTTLLTTLFSNKTKEGFTILLSAICAEETEIFNFIIDLLQKPKFAEALKFNLNAITEEQFMVLQSALRTGKFSRVKIILTLLKKPGFEECLKANLKNITKEGFSVLQQAIASKNADSVTAILALLTEEGLEDILEVNLNTKTKADFTVLLDAIKSINVETIETLIAVLKIPRFTKTLLFNLQFTNKFGYNCLIQAFNTRKHIILQKIDALIDFAYGKNSLLEKKRLLENKAKINPSAFNHRPTYDYYQRIVSSIPQVEQDGEFEEGELAEGRLIPITLPEVETSEKRNKNKERRVVTPTGGIEDKYLGDNLPSLPSPEGESGEGNDNQSYNQRYQLTSLKSFFKQQPKPLPQLIKIRTPEFKADFLTYKTPPSANDRVVFVIAGRKEEALIPLPKKGRCILVLTDEAYLSFNKEIDPYFDILLIKSLQSKSHGVYSQLGMPTCRRLGSFLAAYHFNLSKFMMMDDNIKLVKFNAPDEKWNGLFDLLASQMDNLFCVSVKTDSNKVIKPGMLGSKLFMINLCELKKVISEPKDLFILFPFAKNEDYWGEDYYMQVAFYDLMDKKSQGYKVLGEELATLVRSTQNKNAFAAVGKRAKPFDSPSEEALQGLSPRHQTCIERTHSILNKLIKENIERYNENKALVEHADLLRQHALANGIIPSDTKMEAQQQEGCFFDRFKRSIDNLSFIPSVFRRYQITAIKNIVHLNARGAKLILATGSGKSYIQCEMLRIAYKCANAGEHIIYVTPHIDLVNQFYKDLIEFNQKITTHNADLAIPVENILKVSSHRESCSVKTLLVNKQIATQKTIMIFCVDSLDKYLNESQILKALVPLLLLDEFHYYPSTVENIMSHFKKAESRIIGSTATPPIESPLTDLIFHYSRIQGVKERFLAPVIADSLGVDFSEERVKDLIQCLPLILKQYHPGFAKVRRLKGSKGVIFLPSIEECETALTILREKNIKAYSIHSHNPAHKKEQQAFLESDESGVLLAVKMLRFGFNAKDLAWVIIAQNPKNDHAGWADVEQEIGRVMREMADKIGYVLCFDNVYKSIVAPMLTKQPVTLPVNPDYLAQDNIYCKSKSGKWHVFDVDKTERRLKATFKICPSKIIDAEVPSRSFDSLKVHRDMISNLRYDKIAKCIFSEPKDKYHKRMLLNYIDSSIDLPPSCPKRSRFQ